MLDGFRYLVGNTVVLMSFVVDLIAMIFGMPRALFPQMAHESFGGAADMISAALRSTILQQAASDDLRGRLQGVFLVVVAGGPRIADVVHGGAAELVGTTVAAAGGGALVVLGVLVAALIVPAFVRYRVVRRGSAEWTGAQRVAAELRGSRDRPRPNRVVR